MKLDFELKLFVSYLRRNHHPSMRVDNVWTVARNYRRWVQSQGASSIALELPWINFQALDFLVRILQPSMKVFEYGSGGSSLFFAKHVKEVVSVEHDVAWHKVVCNAAEKNQLKNFSAVLREPELRSERHQISYSDPNGYVSADQAFEQRFHFRSYASHIDIYPDKHFDLVSVDGRSRPACIKHALPKVRPGGYLLLDNSDRDYYLKELSEEMRNFTLVFERFGPGPYSQAFWGTTFYKKNNHE